MLGSYNLDPLSLTVSGEVAIVVRSRRFARRASRAGQRMLQHGPPTVFAYRIARDSAGVPVLDDAAHPEIAFGPCDHSRPESWPDVGWKWRLLALVARLPGMPAIF